MKKHRFDFSFSPLIVTHSLTVKGSVPARQTYNADEDEYEPDYTLTPLVILPIVGIIDKDGTLTSGHINDKLTNIQWTEQQGNTSADITSTSENYQIISSGAENGELIVRRNVSDRQPLTLTFSAEYYDSRTQQVISIKDSILVSCKNASPEVPVLVLSTGDTQIYNPLTDYGTQTVKAQLMLEKKECPAANRLFVWEVMRKGEWVTLGSHNMDYFATVSEDTSELTLDKTLMGDGVSIRCRARYSNTGQPESVALKETSPWCVANVVRRIPSMDYDITGVPSNLPADLMYIYPKLTVYDNQGVISNPEQELMPLWYMATNKASGTLSYTQVAHGYEPKIATTWLDKVMGAVMGVELQDQGPWKALADSDDYALTDDEGNVLLFK
jgi:hypothetical protein